jgi:choline dehydrogenase-like flavoprotein
VDVCIVGAGPAGAVAAKRLAESGFDVVVLEQGDWPDYSRARAAEPDFEIDSAPEWGWNPNVRGRDQDYPIDCSASELDVLVYNAVGGGTVVYAAQWHRSHPSDFRVRTLDGVADDWPLTYEDLRPFYERVEADFGVSGLAGDPALPPGAGPPLPPVPLGRMGRRVAQAHNRLGRHWWPGSNAIATRRYGALRPCVQRAACLFGCADGAKSSVDRTHWPDAIAGGVRLETGARARRVVRDRTGLADGVEWVDRAGREHLTRAGVVILCANGIGTPRLLLLSGLANSSGLVGRRLMLHPFGIVTGLFEDDLDSAQGVWGQHLYSLEFYETDTDRGFVRGGKWGLQPTGGPLSVTRPWPWGDHPLWGAGFHEGVRRRLGHSAMWGIVTEDLPDVANRVMLDATLTDSDGLPAPKIVYRAGENSRRLMDFHLARAGESLLEAGAYETITAPRIRATGWHQLGTARMGTDPATSVVDPWGRTHDVPNLFVFDGSIWPTSTGTNPVATIAAMSLRCTEHLIAERRAQEVPT